MRRLIVVRHGESEANVVGSLHTSVPGPGLTAPGFAQAEALVDALAGEDVRAVWASTMTRARETAAPLAAARGLEVRVVDGLRECYLGLLDDRRDAEAHELFDDVYTGWMVGGELDLRPPGGESGTEVADRWLAALDGVLADLAEGAAVVVSHGAASRLALARRTDVDPGWALRHHLPNTGIVVADEVDGVWRCRSWGGLVPA